MGECNFYLVLRQIIFLKKEYQQLNGQRYITLIVLMVVLILAMEITPLLLGLTTGLLQEFQLLLYISIIFTSLQIFREEMALNGVMLNNLQV